VPRTQFVKVSLQRGYMHRNDSSESRTICLSMNRIIVKLSRAAS